MKESYHICFTSHNEVMFRDEEDHGMMLNMMALRAFATETEILVDAEMSTHVHQNVFTNRPMEYASALRMSYTKYFNLKYGRQGRMGEKYTFLLKVNGHNHQMVLQNYVLRNGLHHQAAATALGYKYCAVREVFAEDIGLSNEVAAPLSRQDIALYLPRHSEFPDEFQMSADGIFLRRSFMEIRRAEQFYGTPRNFLFQMNRLTDEDWKRDQEQDRTDKPLTLDMLEPGYENDIGQLLRNETGRNFNRNRLQDIDVCRLIDHGIIPGYGVKSVYQLTNTQRQRIALQLQKEFHLPVAQIQRCLVLPR